ncbi:MAG: DUF748 domain-containing protein, partial [Caulobacterales bacterium]|nr:DUF748 domain-containing protein [Caulobacterales bacterium]
NLTTLPDDTGDHQVAVVMENGCRVAWEGTLGLRPVLSTGRVTGSGPYPPVLHRYFQDDMDVAAVSGTTDFSFDYQVAAAAEGSLALTMTNASLALRDVAVKAADDPAPFLDLGELRIAGAHAAWPEQAAGAEELTITSLSLDLWSDEAGELNLTRMLTKPAAAEPAPSDAPADPEAKPANADPLQGWSLALARLAVAGAAMRFEDRALRRPGALEFADIALDARDLSSAPGARFPIRLSADLAAGGRVALEGEAALLPEPALTAALTGDELALAAAQPYLSEAARLVIDEGGLSLSADIAMQSPRAWTAAGELTLAALALNDETNAERLVGSERVTVDRFEMSAADNALTISRVLVDGPYVRILIDETEATNFEGLLLAAEPADTATSPDRTAPRPPPSVTIGEVRVENGTADFADRSLPFPFATGISGLEGELSTLATDSPTPARLSLQGQVGEYGLAEVRGEVRLVDPAALTDVSLLFRNIEIPDLSPYTIKFAGRGVADGRMELDLQYLVETGDLKGENNIVISDIALGEKVDQPGAMNLPLGLAIALLKGPEGTIDVNVPVRGDVNDPQFGLGGVIGKAVVNLITGAVTAPFRMLGGLVGLESEDFDRIEFRPGQADLTPPEREKLAKLAEALALRPGLTLSVPSVAAPEVDRSELQVRSVEARIETAVA